ncbi:GFA family protein [Hyphomicrobium sp. 2TAF46]|uniref:GFA family protein n=1 Tax=Hyphomicrobium sp. 2TAF46 TaxID=3233019 RepID=UPI003F8F11F4
MAQKPLSGSCLCGAVRFELRPPIRDVMVCHCRQCAKWTGYALAAAAVSPGDFKLVSGENKLRWYSATSEAERGFCDVCGSSLFWRPRDGSRLSVLAGALDPPTGLVISAHIFVSSKSDYYNISDGILQLEAGGGERSHVVADRRDDH